MADRREFMLAGLGAMTAVSACAGAPPPTAGLAEGADERARAIAGLRPPKRGRPLAAIIADNQGAETTDLLIPFNVLARSGLVDVAVLAPAAGTVPLMPALSIDATDTLAAFDAAHPDGPDYVITPAQHHADSPALVDWIRDKASGGATIIGVCAGVNTVAAAGLIDGRRFTSHWAEISKLRHRHPTAIWRPDRRVVVDRGVVTTTGVTASLPMALALVEAVGGPEKAKALAETLGAPPADFHHHSADFRLDAATIELAVGNMAAVWSHQVVGLPVRQGEDELALAFTADAYSRTYRTRVETLAETATLRTAHGLNLHIQRPGDPGRLDLRLDPPPTARPAGSLDRALADIAHRYGPATAAFVALQVEYPWDARKA